MINISIHVVVVVYQEMPCHSMTRRTMAIHSRAAQISVETHALDSGVLSHDSRSSSDFSVTSKSKDVLEISEVNPEAKFIKVFNISVDTVGCIRLLSVNVFFQTTHNIFTVCTIFWLYSLVSDISCEKMVKSGVMWVN